MITIRRQQWSVALSLAVLLVLVVQVPAVGNDLTDPGGAPFPPRKKLPHPAVESVGTGSGFVVHSNGYVLTNEHVVEGATEVTIVVNDREYEASVKATSDGSDLALLKVNAQGLNIVPLGNSEELEIGDEVYALGCPGGVCGTATA